MLPAVLIEDIIFSKLAITLSCLLGYSVVQSFILSASHSNINRAFLKYLPVICFLKLF